MNFIQMCLSKIINVIKIVLLMFLIAYTSLQILNRTVLVLLGGYILRFPQKHHEFYSNVPVNWVIWTMCLGDHLLDPALSGGLVVRQGDAQPPKSFTTTQLPPHRIY